MVPLRRRIIDVSPANASGKIPESLSQKIRRDRKVDGGHRYGVHPRILALFSCAARASEKLPPARAAFILERRYCPRDSADGSDEARVVVENGEAKFISA